jgi:hypothetical protein
MSEDIELATVADLLSALPKKLKIGTQVWQVTIIEFPPDVRKWGEIDADKQIITVHKFMPVRERLVETVLHEIIHGIWNARNLPEEICEEQAIEHLAPGLLGVFQDNPRFVSWLRRALKPRKIR